MQDIKSVVSEIEVFAAKAQSVIAPLEEVAAVLSVFLPANVAADIALGIKALHFFQANAGKIGADIEAVIVDVENAYAIFVAPKITA